MTIDLFLKNKIFNALVSLKLDVLLDEIIIERAKDDNHGDYASNIALQFSKKAQLKPKELAEKIVQVINMDDLEKIEIAGPGFLNFFLKPPLFQKLISKIIKLNQNNGRGLEKNFKINVEFVSANPTGDFHLGHARCAAIGDAICRLYEFAGYDVVREYYVNDAGAQIEKMGESLRVRYLNEFGRTLKMPEDGYHAYDIIKVAKTLKRLYGTKLIEDNLENKNIFINEGVRLLLDKIIEDLKLFRVTFDLYCFESVIRQDNLIERTIEKYRPFIYVEEGATYLKTTMHGDDKDRPIIKSDGAYTYLVPDIAYHLEKASRGYDLLIDVFGADHHGYTKRIKSSLLMQGYPENIIDFELVQIVRLMKGDEEVKMSKRGWTAITLNELVGEVGVDAARYFFAARAASSHLDFDYNLALEQNSSNPVFYAQYAHARLSRLLEDGKHYNLDLSGSLLNAKAEINLLKHLHDFPLFIELSAKHREPYKIANYIQKLANLIHLFYTECRVLDEENKLLSGARLALCKASKIVLANALNILGVSAPKKM